MYEDKRKRFKIDFKSLLIKMLIFLVIVFLVMWLIAIVSKSDNKKPSNIKDNLQVMKEVAGEYFIGSRLPEKLNEKKKLTLGEMVDSKLIVEFKDQNGKACKRDESYAEVTKISDDEYTIKVKLVCDTDDDYVINTIRVENNDTDTNNDANTEPVVDNNENTNNTDNKVNTGTNSLNTPNSSNSSKPSSTNKPSSSNQQASTNKKPNITYVTSEEVNKTNTTCNYGSMEYDKTIIANKEIPLAYKIEGDCAVSKDDYMKYANEVNAISIKEYTKLYNEVIDLMNTTGAKLEIAKESYSGVYNKTNNGLVGYTIKFQVKQNQTYSLKTIYEYYLDQNGNRLITIDNLASLYPYNNNMGTGLR